MLPPYVPNYTNFKPGDQILYSGPYWDEKELEAAYKAFTKGKWLTSGEHVARFQNLFSQVFGVKLSHMVNSGSSANLVMVAALKKHLEWNDGDEVVVSPVGFPTTIAPLVQNGLSPVFVDIEMDTLNFDTKQIRSKITDKTRAIFVSPVLGNPPDIDELRSICKENGLKLVGDNCDSLGSKWNGEYLNAYYYAWSSSFYPAHHLCTGEGGMISSNDVELIKLTRSLSWWGRACYCTGAANLLPCGTCGKRFSKWLEGVDYDLDHKYVFDSMGWNLKPLDMQGAIGIEQLKKFADIDYKRKQHYSIIASYFSSPKVRLAKVMLQAEPCWFGVPVICESKEIRESLVEYLESNKIQTRPYFAGNLLRHEGYKHLDKAEDFPNADKVLSRVFFLGVYPGYTAEVLDHIGKVLLQWQTQN